jgi:hypothetical protein
MGGAARVHNRAFRTRLSERCAGVTPEEMRQHARDLVADWPPLSDHQKDVIAWAFRTPRRDPGQPTALSLNLTNRSHTRRPKRTRVADPLHRRHGRQYLPDGDIFRPAPEHQRHAAYGHQAHAHR